MTDETADVLARHGSPVSTAEYAIHQAHGRYRAATEGATRRDEFDLAAQARKAELVDALIAYDRTSVPGERDTLLIGEARDRVASTQSAFFREPGRSGERQG